MSEAATCVADSGAAIAAGGRTSSGLELAGVAKASETMAVENSSLFIELGRVNPLSGSTTFDGVTDVALPQSLLRGST